MRRAVKKRPRPLPSLIQISRDLTRQCWRASVILAGESAHAVTVDLTLPFRLSVEERLVRASIQQQFPYCTMTRLADVVEDAVKEAA